MKRHILPEPIPSIDLFVGIDVHAKSWKTCILTPQFEHKLFSSDPDPGVIIDYLHRNFPSSSVKLVYEAGYFGFESARAFNAAGYHCMVVHPADIPSAHKERDQKNDTVDARKLAYNLRAGTIQGIHIPDESKRAHYSLILQRRFMVSQIGKIKKQIKAYLTFIGQKIDPNLTQRETISFSKRYQNWLRELPLLPAHRLIMDNYLKTISVLRQELLHLNKQIRNLSRTPEYEREVQIMMSVPGIGLIGGMTILTKIENFNRFKTNDQLCAMFGLIPSTSSSGAREVAYKITNRGCKELRRIILESAWVAIRVDPALCTRYHELIKRMKPNQAILRIARSMINRIRTIMINDTPYQKAHY
ncbi:MAG: IS110 family transposase [Bacteroidota bacterium]|nr:IS110 family transposase [Bacteroidota bacterium]MDX5429984.1 IS110 family transposase [Bacteroidota bacterium]MDX5468757.1 IS110 family transposase [Bacteroidota bacterium]